MSIYTIEWLESKQTSTGKNKYDVTLKDDKGVVTDKVTIWEGFPDFANLRPGHTIDADIVVKQNGQYTNKTAYQTKTYSQWKPKAGSIAKAQEVKGEQIHQAQENKELGIKVSSTIRMAVDLAIAEHGEGKTDVTYQNSIKNYRAWLWTEWDKENKDNPPF